MKNILTQNLIAFAFAEKHLERMINTLSIGKFKDILCIKNIKICWSFYFTDHPFC